MHLFKIRLNGMDKPMFISARNKDEAVMKAKRLLGSRGMFKVRDPPLRPGALSNTRRLFKGKSNINPLTKV